MNKNIYTFDSLITEIDKGNILFKEEKIKQQTIYTLSKLSVVSIDNFLKKNEEEEENILSTLEEKEAQNKINEEVKDKTKSKEEKNQEVEGKEQVKNDLDNEEKLKIKTSTEKNPNFQIMINNNSKDYSFLFKLLKILVYIVPGIKRIIKEKISEKTSKIIGLSLLFVFSLFRAGVQYFSDEKQLRICLKTLAYINLPSIWEIILLIMRNNNIVILSLLEIIGDLLLILILKKLFSNQAFQVFLSQIKKKNN